MKVLTNFEQVFSKTPDGLIWGPGIYTKDYWSKYLTIFDGVKVIARINKIKEVGTHLKRIDTAGIEFIGLPYYQGPWKFCMRAFEVIKIIRASVDMNDAVIITVPSTIASFLGPPLRRAGHPYGAQVVGDPYEVFSEGSVNSAFRRLFQRWYTKSQEKICANANGAVYVTRNVLQKKYPCKNAEFAVSDVDIDIFINEKENYPDKHQRVSNRWNSAFLPRGKDLFRSHGEKVEVVTVGSMEQMYKGIDLVMAATADLKRKGFDIKLTIIGDGRNRRKLEENAKKLNIWENTQFLGNIEHGRKLLQELNTADVFVLASRTEGLPRAMMEAMSIGLPCIGSDVGGIPELLDKADIFPPNNIKALTEKLVEVITEKGRLDRMILRNVEKAKEFRREKLDKHWIQFIMLIKNETEEWLDRVRYEDFAPAKDNKWS
jgi:glycosyltransferase involved in cell wall biosynthesis